MAKFKYILIIIICFFIAHNASAFHIEYGTFLGNSGNNVLIEYYGIGGDNAKINYLCDISTLQCDVTNKKTLGAPIQRKMSRSILRDLNKRKAIHRTFSPSGKLLAYYLPAKDPVNIRTYVIKNLKTGKQYSISQNIGYWDLTADNNKIFEFSPDGNRLLYLDDKDGFMAIYSVDITKLSGASMKSKKINTGAFTVADFAFYDNKTLYYIANQKDNPYNWILYKLNLKTGTSVAIESNVSYVDPIKKIGTNIIFNHLQAQGYGPEIYSAVNKKLLSFNIPNIDTKNNLANQKIIKAGNSYGVLMTPTGNDVSKTYPLVIWLHGGPVRQTSYGYHPYHSYGLYDSILELLRRNNVVVLKLDYRGSIGFGRAYSESIVGSVGKGDIADVMDAITYAKSKYNISNVYISGNSYGGYMVLKTVAEHPDSVTGVLSINGVTDWESLVVKMQHSIFNTDFYGLPNASNRVFYDQASIINRINNIGNQKITLVQGQADVTIPPWQADMLYDKLKSSGKNVTIVKYPGEDHVFKEKKTVSDLCNQMFNFVGVPVDPECNN